MRLTDYQRALLRELARDGNRTYAEIGAALGWSKVRVGSVAHALQARGLLRISGVHGVHELTRAGRAVVVVP